MLCGVPRGLGAEIGPGLGNGFVAVDVAEGEGVVVVGVVGEIEGAGCGVGTVVCV